MKNSFDAGFAVLSLDTSYSWLASGGQLGPLMMREMIVGPR